MLLPIGIRKCNIMITQQDCARPDILRTETAGRSRQCPIRLVQLAVLRSSFLQRAETLAIRLEMAQNREKSLW